MLNNITPTKRVVIAGCRDYNNYDEAKNYIDFCLSNIRKENNIVIVSGCASGADALGERYAKENGFAIEKYPADWKTYGLSAGPRRNKQMADYAAETGGILIAFWDGESRGTKMMIKLAKMSGLCVKVFTTGGNNDT